MYWDLGWLAGIGVGIGIGIGFGQMVFLSWVSFGCHCRTMVVEVSVCDGVGTFNSKISIVAVIWDLQSPLLVAYAWWQCTGFTLSINLFVLSS